jgi:hypothetical protein
MIIKKKVQSIKWLKISDLNNDMRGEINLWFDFQFLIKERKLI